MLHKRVRKLTNLLLLGPPWLLGRLQLNFLQLNLNFFRRSGFFKADFFFFFLNTEFNVLKTL